METYKNSKVIRDTVHINWDKRPRIDSSDIIRTEAIGRFDRGIINFRYMPKGKWTYGITASYSNFDSKESQMLSILKDFDCSTRTYGLNPFIGYFYKDNMMIGAKLGYEHTVVDIGHISLDFDEDIDLSLSDFYYSEDLYSVAAIHRSYVGLDTGKRFGLFSETYFEYKNGSSTLIRGAGRDQVKTHSQVNEFKLNMSPGVSCFIMQNVCVEMSIGVIGLKYRTERQKEDEVYSGKLRNSGANFKINLFNIKLGVTVCL